MEFKQAKPVYVIVFLFRDKIPSGHYSIPMSPQSPGEQDICGNILLLTIMNALYCIDVVSNDFFSFRSQPFGFSCCSSCKQRLQSDVILS